MERFTTHVGFEQLYSRAYVFHSFSITSAICLPARRSHFFSRPRRSFNTVFVRLGDPKCTLATSFPIACSSVYSSRFFGNSSTSIGFESGDKRRTIHPFTTFW